MGKKSFDSLSKKSVGVDPRFNLQYLAHLCFSVDSVGIGEIIHQNFGYFFVGANMFSNKIIENDFSLF